jgi:hypothetical protein
LLSYCRQDTLGLVKLLERLRRTMHEKLPE